MAKAPKETKITVTLAKGACLSSATETHAGGDALEVGLAQAARMHVRGMIEPVKGQAAKTLAEYIAAQDMETAEAQAPAKETAAAPAQTPAPAQAPATATAPATDPKPAQAPATDAGQDASKGEGA